MVEVYNIQKKYGDKRGIEKLYFRAKSREVVALIGPNGSGKSTALNIICGREKSDSGAAFINGINTFNTSARERIGYLPDDFSAYDKMTIYGLLKFISKNKYRKDLSQEIEYYLKDLDIWERRHEYISSLSFGLKSKVALIVSILGAPDLIILDEPTNALDTKGIILLKKYIKLLKHSGSTIIITSNLLDFIKDISTRIIFLKDGRVINDTICTKNMILDDIYKELYF